MKFRPVTLDASLTFVAMHMISENATQGDRFVRIPSLLARALQIRWVSMALVRCLIATPEVLAEAAFPEAREQGDAGAWCAGAIAQLSFGNSEMHCADRVIGGAGQHWVVSPVSGQVYLFARFDLTGAASGGIVSMLDTLVVHAARVASTSLFWHESPTGLGEPLNRLTPREWEVLRAIHSADPEKLIAERLAVSPHTFHVHIKKIYRKLNVRSRLSLMELCRDVADERLVAAVAPLPVDSCEPAFCPA